MELALQKLAQCQVVFDFTDSLHHIKSKEIKRSALIELKKYMDELKKNSLEMDEVTSQLIVCK